MLIEVVFFEKRWRNLKEPLEFVEYYAIGLRQGETNRVFINYVKLCFVWQCYEPMRPGSFHPLILLPVDLHRLCVEFLSVVKPHVLPQLELDGPLIYPPQILSQTRHHVVIFVQGHQTLGVIPDDRCGRDK